MWSHLRSLSASGERSVCLGLAEKAAAGKGGTRPTMIDAHWSFVPFKETRHTSSFIPERGSKDWMGKQYGTVLKENKPMKVMQCSYCYCFERTQSYGVFGKGFFVK